MREWVKVSLPANFQPFLLSSKSISSKFRSCNMHIYFFCIKPSRSRKRLRFRLRLRFKRFERPKNSTVIWATCWWEMAVTELFILYSLTWDAAVSLHQNGIFLLVSLEQVCKTREMTFFVELFLLLILCYMVLFSQDFQPQRLDDGYLEVIGLTSATLVSGIVNQDCKENLKLLVTCDWSAQLSYM